MSDLEVLSSSDPETVPAAALDLRRIETALINGCVVQAAGPGFDRPLADQGGSEAIVLEDCRAWIADSSLTAGSAPTYTNAIIGIPTPGSGCRAIRSEVHLVGVTSTGGRGGGYGILESIALGPSGPGLELLEGSTASVSSGTGSSITGGPGQFKTRGVFGEPNPPTFTTAGGPGAFVAGDSSLTVAAGESVEGGLDGEGLIQAPPFEVEPGGVLELHLQRLPVLELSPSEPAPGDAVALRVYGESGVGFVFWAPSFTAPLALPGFDGATVLPLDQAKVIAVLVLDGMPPPAEQPLTIPLSFPLRYCPLTFQGLLVQTDGSSPTTNPTPLTVAR